MARSSIDTTGVHPLAPGGRASIFHAAAAYCPRSPAANPHVRMASLGTRSSTPRPSPPASAPSGGGELPPPPPPQQDMSIRPSVPLSKTAPRRDKYAGLSPHSSRLDNAGRYFCRPAAGDVFVAAPPRPVGRGERTTTDEKEGEGEGEEAAGRTGKKSVYRPRARAGGKVRTAGRGLPVRTKGAADGAANNAAAAAATGSEVVALMAAAVLQSRDDTSPLFRATGQAAVQANTIQRQQEGEHQQEEGHRQQHQQALSAWSLCGGLGDGNSDGDGSVFPGQVFF